jgi:hypothetical protein
MEPLGVKATHGGLRLAPGLGDQAFWTATSAAIFFVFLFLQGHPIEAVFQLP